MKIIISLCLSILLFSCGTSAKQDLMKMDALIEKLKGGAFSGSESDLEKLESEFQAINNHFQANRSSYSKEEVENYNRKVGQFYVALASAGLEQIQNGLKDFEQQLKGAADAMGADEAIDGTEEESDNENLN